MKRNNFQKDILGQFFTPKDIVKKMLALRQNRGKVLEPSAGEGIFMQYLEKTARGIEIDKSLCAGDRRIIKKDFFQLSVKNKFATIIGNPPYVRHQDIASSTKKMLDMKLFDRRSNLYLFFIAKCVEHLQDGGELIFITPRDFLKATSAKKLNAMLFENGSMTHYYEMGDRQIFTDATPNCAVWRWQKGLKNRKMKVGGIFNCINGQIIFEKNSKSYRANNTLGNFFEIKVGAVSGADSIFTSKKYGNIEMVYSQTRTSGKTRKVIYNENHKCLQKYKQHLLNRKIKKFSNKNWWCWGRNFHEKEGERIYVNTKTRQQNPFFISNIKAYDGSVLALFPKKKLNIEKAVAKLNKINWQQLGFMCDGRLIFTQNSLTNAPIGNNL